MAQGPVTFDIHRQTTPEASAERWEELRQAPGLCHFARYGGFFVASRYEDVMQVLLHPEIFSSAKGITLPPPDTIRSFHIPAEIDPPAHGEYRSLVQPLLGPADARAMEPAIRGTVRELIAAIPCDESVDFVRAFARPLPIIVALDLLRISRDEAAAIEQMVEDLHHEVATGEATGAGRRLEAFAYEVLDRRAAEERPGTPDLVTAVLEGQAFGRPLEREEQMSMIRLIMVGGFDTTSIALANLAKWLAENPAERDRVAAKPRLVDGLCEEIVRVASPSTYLRREVVQATELAGTSLQPGDSVLVAFGAANLDPAKFGCPASIQPERKPNPHVGFGAGRHRCIGSFVAKAQMRVACEELLEAFDRFAIDGEKPIRYSSGLGQGIISLPMRLGRSPR